MTCVALVPGVLALLPEYAGIEDPVADLRAAALEAVAWLGPEVVVLGDAQGERVARYLLEASRLVAGAPRTSATEEYPSYLVVANGSATRTEKAPGHLDERAAAFDAALGASLRAGRPEVDADLADELWASVDGIVALAARLPDLGPAQVDHDEAPFGVQYWVMRWTCSP